MEPSAQQSPQPLQAVVSPPAPTKKSFKIPLIIILFIFLILVPPSVIAGLLIYTKVNIPFISQNQRNSILILSSKIPLIPKTPEQILLAAIDSNSKLTTYNPEFSLSGTLGSTAIGAGSIDLKVKGPVDLTPGRKSSFDLAINAGVNFTGTLYEGSGQLRKVEDTVYFKVDKISDSVITAFNSLYSGFLFKNREEGFSVEEVKNNLNNVFTYWLSYDTKGIESEARKLIEDQSQNQSIIDETRKKSQEILLSKDVLPNVKKLKDEDVEGTKTYHLQLIPTKENIKAIIELSYSADARSNEYVQKSISEMVENIESVEMDLWFGKRDTILRRLAVKIQLKIGNIPFYTSGTLTDTPLPSFGDLGTPKITLSTVLTIRDIGKPVKVEIPTPVKTAAEYSTILMDATKTEEQKQQELLLKDYQTDFKAFSPALLKYYVEKGVYPLTLSELSGIYLTDESTVSRMENYTYSRSSDGTKYILYVEYQSPYSHSASTPYYGITATLSYPFQLTQKDFDSVN